MCSLLGSLPKLTTVQIFAFEERVYCTLPSEDLGVSPDITGPSEGLLAPSRVDSPNNYF